MADGAVDPLSFLFSNPALLSLQTPTINSLSGGGAVTTPTGQTDFSLGSGYGGGSAADGSTTDSTDLATDIQQGASSPAGVYNPGHPEYLSTYNTGMGTMRKLLTMLHTPDDSVTVPAAKDTSLFTQPHAETTPTETAPVTTPTGNDNEYDRVVGNGTTFGLDYGTGNSDPGDPGHGSAFGYTTADKNLEGASLPLSVITNTIGDYTKDPAIMAAIKRGDYKVAVTNQNGTTKVVPIVDAGPADWTGNALDLTYKTSHDLETNGKAKVGYQIIGPDGSTIPIRGYHPGAGVSGNWDDHINYNQAATTRGSAPEEPKIDIQANDYSPGRGDQKIRNIILHSSDGSEKSDINTLTGKGTGVSAHYYVTRDGRVMHFVSEGDSAYQAGKTKYGDNGNPYTIGIEQEHVDGKQDWTDAQVKATAQTVAGILQRHPDLTLSDVIGHADLAGERKQDPVDYPWDQFRKYVQDDLGGGSAAVAKTEAEPTVAPAKSEEESELQKASRKEETPPSVMPQAAAKEPTPADRALTAMAKIRQRYEKPVQVKTKSVVKRPEERPSFV